MKFAVSIGTYELLSYAELNILQCRRVFGADVPILLSDGRSTNSGRMMDLAAKHDCFYSGESVNRGHFMGCAQNSVHALAFAENQGADIAVKINQRLILLSPKIREIVEMIFSNPNIQIALPGRPDPSRILTSKFFSRFQFLNDVMFIRVGSVTPEWFKTSYENQVKSRSSHVDMFTETHVANVIRQLFPTQHATIPALTNHHQPQPYLYLRKVQNKRADFVAAAMDNSMSHFDYPVSEWKELRGSNYKPFPVIT